MEWDIGVIYHIICEEEYKIRLKSILIHWYQHNLCHLQPCDRTMKTWHFTTIYLHFDKTSKQLCSSNIYMKIKIQIINLVSWYHVYFKQRIKHLIDCLNPRWKNILGAINRLYSHIVFHRKSMQHLHGGDFITGNKETKKHARYGKNTYQIVHHITFDPKYI